MVSHNESLAQYIIKNEISQLLSKFKHESDIHEHKKYKFEITDEKGLSSLLVLIELSNNVVLLFEV